MQHTLLVPLGFSAAARSSQSLLLDHETEDKDLKSMDQALRREESNEKTSPLPLSLSVSSVQKQTTSFPLLSPSLAVRCLSLGNPFPSGRQTKQARTLSKAREIFFLMTPFLFSTSPSFVLCRRLRSFLSLSERKLVGSIENPWLAGRVRRKDGDCEGRDEGRGREGLDSRIRAIERFFGFCDTRASSIWILCREGEKQTTQKEWRRKISFQPRACSTPRTSTLTSVARRSL